MEIDMILPEGFDPEKGDANFTENGELADVTEVPTTEQTEAEAETQAVQETAEEQAPTTEPQTEVVPEQPKVKVRYNHEDRELSIDEAAVYAQKGMNYDRIEQKNRELEEKIRAFEQKAKLFGYDNADVMMTQAETNFVEQKVQELINQGNPEAMARFLVAQEIKDKKASAVPAPAPTPAPVGLSDEQKSEIREFHEAYPTVTKIPDEVFSMHRSGMRLKDAYETWDRQKSASSKLAAERDKAVNELAILRQNQASAAKGPVSGSVGKADTGKSEAEDPFLKGFNSWTY